MKIPMKLAYQYIAIFFNFPTTSNHLHPLQVENCDSNSRLVVDEDDNGKSRPERVNDQPVTSARSLLINLILITPNMDSTHMLLLKEIFCL